MQFTRQTLALPFLRAHRELDIGAQRVLGVLKAAVRGFGSFLGALFPVYSGGDDDTQDQQQGQLGQNADPLRALVEQGPGRVEVRYGGGPTVVSSLVDRTLTVRPLRHALTSYAIERATSLRREGPNEVHECLPGDAT